MNRPEMLPHAEWHEKLAEIHALDANLEQSQYYAKESARLKAESDKALANKNPLVRLKAKPLLVESRRKEVLSAVYGSEANHADHVTHVLAAAQIRAVAEERDATIAAHKALMKMLASSDPAIVKAAKAHPTAKLLGIK